MLEKEIADLMEQYRLEMIERCNQGMCGSAPKLKVTRINYPITEMCNCYCVMCDNFLKIIR